MKYFLRRHARQAIFIVVASVLLGCSVISLMQFSHEFFFSPGYFKGTHNDFLAFYTTGQLASSGRIEQVYDATTLTELQRLIVPHPVSALGYMPFLNPPFVAVLLAPLGWFNVNDARLVWMLINVALMIGIGWYLTRTIVTGWQRALVLLLLVTSYPVFQNLIQGQLSIAITAIVLLGLHFALQRRMIATGACLAILTIKPQLAVMVGIGLLVFRQWEMIKGMVIAAAVCLLVTLPLTGTSLYQTYAEFSAGVSASHVSGAGRAGDSTWEGNMKYMYSLPGLSVALIGQDNVTATNLFTYGIGAALITLFFLAARRLQPSLFTTSGRLVLAAGIAIILLINPHAYSQDAMLLYIPMAILLLIWRTSYMVIIFLASIALMYPDQMAGSHWLTISLLLSIIYILVATIRQKWPVIVLRARKLSHRGTV